MRNAPIYLFAAALLAQACAPADDFDSPGVSSARQELLGGELTGDEDDLAVVALAGANFVFCTGTLITPRVVLTAAHCIDSFDFTNPTTGVFFGGSQESGNRLSVTGGATIPTWTGNVSSNNPTDVGLLLLRQAVDPSLPIPLNTRPPEVGETYRHVGFGQFEPGNADGQKRTGTVTVSDTTSGLILSGTSEINVCFGDSGGPGFVLNEGVEHVAGIHSFTQSSQCLAPSGDARVDANLDFIHSWLAANDPSCGPDRICSPTGCQSDPDCDSCGADGVCVICADGEDPDCPSKDTGDPCQIEDECSGGRCIVWDGDFKSKFCSEECTTDDQCPSGMSCRFFSEGNACYWDSEPAGVLGDSCEAGPECSSNICDQSECVVACNVGAGLECPDGFLCQDNGEGRFFCRSDGSGGGDGGCAAGGNGSGPLALVLLALLGLARRRRR